MDAVYYYLILMLIFIIGGLLILFRLWFSTNKLHRINCERIAAQRIQEYYLDDLHTLYHESGILIDEIDHLFSAGNALSSDISSTSSLSAANKDARLNAEKNCLTKCEELLAVINSGDTLTDALLNHKRSLCESNGIIFHAKFQDIPSSYITDSELISLLGNLLDNALEAAMQCHSKEAFVAIESFVQRGAWLLKVSNSKPSDLHPLKNGMKTTKKKPDKHGMGTVIIRDIVSRYAGNITAEDTGDTFIVTVGFVL